MSTKAKQMLYTQEGYQALVDELEYLKGTKRQQVKEDIATARSFGDLSENSEYDEARNEQAKVEGRITELEALILNAVIVDESKIDTSIVNMGSTVKVYDEEFDEYYCMMDLDEDEVYRFFASGRNRCPYYRQGDDYTLARRQ